MFLVRKIGRGRDVEDRSNLKYSANHCECKICTGWPNIVCSKLLSTSSPSIDRFSKFFHHTLSTPIHYVVKYKISKNHYNHYKYVCKNFIYWNGFLLIWFSYNFIFSIYSNFLSSRSKVSPHLFRSQHKFQSQLSISALISCFSCLKHHCKQLTMN